MARKTKEEAQRTRARILDAAVEVFHQRGVAHPSLTDVAALIGMTRGAVYGHFSNKSEVLAALFDRERLPWESLAVEAAAGQGDPLGTLRLALARLLHKVCESPLKARTLNILFFKIELAVENELLVQRIEAAKRESREHVSALLRRAIDAGQVPPGRDPERDARFVLSAIFGVLMDWLWEPDRFDLAAEAEAIVDALLLPLEAGRCPQPARARLSRPTRATP